MKTVPLRYLAEINPPTPAFDAVRSDEEVGFLPLEAVWNDARADHARRVPKREVATGYTRYQAGDVLSPKVTPTFQAGRSMIATTVGAGTTELHILRPRDGVDSRWVAYALRSKHFLEEGVTAFQGVAGLQRVPAEFVAAFRVVDHPVEEQRRIADFLDDRVARIDRIIAARRLQQDLLESQLLAQIRLGVAGVLDERQAATASPIPWLAKLSGEARVAKLARVLTMQRGVDLTADEQRPGDVPVITTAGVTGWHDVAVAPGPGVVIGRYGSVGSVHWVEEDYWPHNTTLYLKDAHGNSLRWAYYLLRSFPYAALQARAAVPGVNRNDMAAEDVPIIPRPLQDHVADVLDAHVMEASRWKAAIAGSTDLLTEYKQSLITAAVTGELDVTTAGSGIPE